jgi:YD repeat-containing protein
MRTTTLLRIGTAASIALAGSAAPATPIVALTAANRIVTLLIASQIITFTYDPSGRVTAIVYTGTGAPNGCTNSTPTWGTGTLGCLRWSP